MAVHFGGAADQFDALHRVRRDAAQNLFEAFFLAGGRLAVDQDVADRAGKAANAGIAVLQAKARHQLDHVQRGGGLVFHEEGGRIGGQAIGRGLGERRLRNSKRGGSDQKRSNKGAKHGVFVRKPPDASPTETVSLLSANLA